MARDQLRHLEGKRAAFTGTFERFGHKRDYGRDKPTVLLKDIRDERGELVDDHMWFNLTKGFKRLVLQEGDRVAFDARVKSYQKGYKGRREDVFKPLEWDYKLSYPTKVRRVEEDGA